MTHKTHNARDRRALTLAERFSAAFLVAGTILMIGDLLSGTHLFALFALVMILLYVGLRWPVIRVSGRVMLLLAVAAGPVILAVEGSTESLALAASHALYLPALLAVMALLRTAAKRSHLVAVAAQFVVDQPPSRRFVYLATGGHVFGMLLNIGGLQLLLGIALTERDRAAPTAAVREVQGRRITNAILRGFGATLLWSPVGLAINLLLPVMPTLDWLGYLPYGLSLMAAFLSLGWVFDQMEPPPRRRYIRSQREGTARALFALMALLIAITGAAAVAEFVFELPLRVAILLTIPIMALAWSLLTETGAPGEIALSLGRDTFASLPDSANEICIVGAASFLGLVIAEMIPPEGARTVVETLSLGPGALACATIVIMIVCSLGGISPMITGVICVGAILAAEVPMPEPMIMVAALCGWCGVSVLIKRFLAPTCDQL